MEAYELPEVITLVSFFKNEHLFKVQFVDNMFLVCLIKNAIALLAIVFEFTLKQTCLILAFVNSHAILIIFVTINIS